MNGVLLSLRRGLAGLGGGLGFNQERPAMSSRNTFKEVGLADGGLLCAGL